MNSNIKYFESRKMLLEIVKLNRLEYNPKIRLLIIFLALFLATMLQVKSQNWDMKLNQIVPPYNPDFGTMSNDPINFFTNGNLQMSLSTSGVLKINNLSGSSNRFLQADQEGNIFPWNGSSQYPNHILFGDGSFRPNLILVDGSNMSIPLNSKFGLGTSNPDAELDVIGSAKVSNNLAIQNKIHIGGVDQYAIINYSASTTTSPAIFNFRPVGGGSNGGNGNGNTGGNGEDSPDPLPDLSCINGQISTINAFSNLLTVKAPYNSSSLGNINIGHNGSRAFIETQGTNSTSQGFHPGNLFVNSQCNRNVYFFSDNGNAFAPSQNKLISIYGRLNLTDLMQIGTPTFTNFVETGSKLYVYASGIQDGIKIRHGGIQGGGAIKAVELSDSDKGISVYRGTQTNDGSEMFSVQGDGLTVISPLNNKALSIQKAGNETFSIDQNGYTEIKVYSSSGMPNNRVISIKDIGTSRDLFAIKSNGKVYAREIEINLLTNFPDYVFDENYKLPSLKYVRDYIMKNKHLPGYNKGDYYENNGINVTEMILKQQEKIEELTLYILQLEKKMDSILEK